MKDKNNKKIKEWIKKKQYDKVVDYYVKENKSYCLELPFSRINLDFVSRFMKCTRCGKCCSTMENREGSKHIPLLADEPKKIAKICGLKEKTVKDFYCLEIDGQWYLKVPCIFLKKITTGGVQDMNDTSKCKIYNERPTVCRMYPFQNPIEIKFEGMAYSAITLSPHCPAVRNFLTEQWLPGLTNYEKLIQAELRKQKNESRSKKD